MGLSLEKLLAASRCRATNHNAMRGKHSNKKFTWHSAIARCQGSSHIKNSTPCQDHVYEKLYDNGVRVIALSDGAGSARLSHYGAYLTVTSAADVVADKFDDAFFVDTSFSFGKNLALYLQRRIMALSCIGINLDESERAAQGQPSRDKQLLVPCSPKDLSSTLLLVAIKEGRYLTAHLGDGVIGIEEQLKCGRKTIRALSKPENGEFSNVTVFTTSASACESMRIYTGQINMACKKTTGFILMSDGPEHALYDKRKKTLAPACSKLINAARVLPKPSSDLELERVLKKVIAKKTSDDCSIAILAK